MVAIDTQTSSIDPMQATLCGFALAVAPNEACYVPLAHRQGGDGDGGGLFAGGLAPDQITESAALGALKPLLEDPASSRSARTASSTGRCSPQRGIELRPTTTRC